MPRSRGSRLAAKWRSCRPSSRQETEQANEDRYETGIGALVGRFSRPTPNLAAEVLLPPFVRVVIGLPSRPTTEDGTDRSSREW